MLLWNICSFLSMFLSNICSSIFFHLFILHFMNGMIHDDLSHKNNRKLLSGKSHADFTVQNAELFKTMKLQLYDAWNGISHEIICELKKTAMMTV